MLNKPFVSVIIVNYNSGAYAAVCITALLKQDNVRLEVLVVDNHSADNSVSLLKSTFDNQIILIESATNLGFGRANNLAAKQASGDYLLLLNPDTDITNPNAINKLVAFLIDNPSYGLVGPAIIEARRKRADKNNFVPPRLTYPAQGQLSNTQLFAGLPGEIAWLLGACLLFKRDIFDAINGFDADYFLYGEDADIGLRLRQHGYAIGYCPAVEITHVAGASEISSASYDKWLRKKRGLYLFFTKHYPANDVINIARAEIRKCQLYLLALKIKSIFYAAQKSAERKNRLLATIDAAKEALTKSLNT